MVKLLIFYFVIICLFLSQYQFELYPIQLINEIEISVLYHDELHRLKLPLDSRMVTINSLYPEIEIDWNYFNPNTIIYNDDYIVLDKKNDHCISINHASIDELITLPGIKHATAQKIIDYRTINGLFQNLEDLMKVSGIKENKYSQLKAKICL